ncbi:MAG: PAS domain S-box protein [Lacibacter sp.]
MPDKTTVQEVYDLFFHHTPDLICIAGKDGYFRKINRAVTEKLGYTVEELLQMPIHALIHPDDRQLTAQKRDELLQGKSLLNFQNRYRTKAGNYIWLEWTSVYFPEQEVVFAIAKDITTRKLAELEIRQRVEQYRKMAGHFKQRNERDRQNLSLELHEDLAQLTAVLTLNLQQLQATEQNLTPNGQELLQQSKSLCDMLVQTIRRISFSVSPGMLQDLGLVATLEWLCNEFTAVSGIVCRFSGQCNETRLSFEKQLDMFRICQEALQNVLSHAKAAEVTVSLTENDTHVQLSVADNGRGFLLPLQKETSGLQHMRSLAATIHATLHIHTAVGRGTEIVLQVPH